MALAGPEIVKLTGVPSATGCPSAPVTVAVTVWTSPGDRVLTSWLSVRVGVPADDAGGAATTSDAMVVATAAATARERKERNGRNGRSERTEREKRGTVRLLGEHGMGA